MNFLLSVRLLKLLQSRDTCLVSCSVQHVLNEATSETLLISVKVVAIFVSASHVLVIHDVALMGLSPFVVLFEHGLDLVLVET